MRAVIPSVNYADFLAETLPAWCRVLGPGAITVVTSPSDRETREVARANGVRCHVTSAWTADGAVLNKALALDEAFGFVPGATEPPKVGDLCVSIDADGYPFGRLDTSRIEPMVLYGAWRHECLDPAALRGHVNGAVPLSQFPRLKTSGGRPVGFFQLFRWFEGLRFGSFPSAAKYDIRFIEQFPRWEMRDDGFYLLHLGQSSVKANWRGRVVPAWAS